MQYLYGELMPLRVLDEIEFWKHQEKENTTFIRELAEDLERKYVRALKDWEKEFVKTYHRVNRYIETVKRSNGRASQSLYQDILQLTRFCLHQSEKFIAFCNTMMEDSESISSNETAKVVIQHIIMKSEYFIGLFQKVLDEG